MGNKKILIITILLILEIVCVIFVFKNKEFMEVTKTNNFELDKNVKNIALMIEQSDGSYKENTNNLWPKEGYKFNENLSKCIDKFGNDLEGVLNFKNGVLEVRTTTTSYCYLYFDIDDDALTEPKIIATVENNTSPSPKFSINSNKEGTYCVNRSSSKTDMTNCTFQGSILADVTISTNSLSAGADGSNANAGVWYVHVKDSFGNISISNSLNVVLTWCNVGTNFGDCLKSRAPQGLNVSTAFNGLYRYIGTTVNNRVRLIGGGKQSDFKIIGVVSSDDSTTGYNNNSVKLIKKSTIINYVWHTTGLDTNWDDAYLNKNFLNTTVLNDTNVFPTGWVDKLDAVKWYVADITPGVMSNASSIAAFEKKEVSANSTKVGLINISDPYYATEAGGTINCYSTTCSTWMTEPTSFYWTLNKREYSSESDMWLGWLWGHNSDLTQSGYAHGISGLVGEFGIRPVVYLLNTVTYQSGMGTSSDPFIIN